ncbi:MAG: adenylyl-sulfate kinase [Selenomonadaceae bacterium]|nr:adenylyl-sulfate kinase [Selenomonadaceae bacterium]
MREGYLYWVTGLSGAGKTTIGTLLYNEIKRRKPNVFLLDGDVARWAYNDSAGYTRSEREAVAYRHARVCKMITDQDIDVICCTVSMFDGVRQWNRDHFANYREIFIDVPMEVLIERDKKGLYSQALDGSAQNVVGVDLQLEYPRSPDLKLLNDGSEAPSKILERILKAFPEFDGWEVEAR